ncbi:MAG: hypothetical protein AAB414_03670 [Patescibacteria group bacterium]
MVESEVVARLSKLVPKQLAIDVVGGSVYWAIKNSGLIDAFGRSVRNRFPRFVHVNSPSSEFRNKFLKLLPEGTPLGLGPHGSHVEGLVIADEVNELVNIAREEGMGDLLPGFIIPVAASMESGHQGPFLKGIYPHMRDYAVDRRLKFMPSVREKDKKTYGMTPRLQDIKDFNAEMASGMGVMALPEASVQAGRHPRWYFPFGPVNGMQEVKSEDLLKLYRDAKFHGRGEHPFFVLMVHTGAHHLYSADSLLPTQEGLIGLWDTTTNFFVRFGYKRPIIEASFVEVVSDEDLGIADIDMRHLKDEAKEKVIKHINSYLMRKIAMAMDERYRGFYKTQ